jgi:hypothetical protein
VYRRVVVSVLRGIPGHRDSPKTVGEIARSIGSEHATVASHDLEMIVAALIVVLDTFGVVSSDRSRYKLRGPIGMYFLYSLAWYVASGSALVDNWTRTGVREEMATAQLLDTAPHLLKLMDDKRLRLGGAGVEPRRRQQVAFTLVKTRHDGKSYFLFEWDRPAAQYQLIGGHFESGDDARTAALQEFAEEMDVANGRPVVQGRDFELMDDLEWSDPQPIRWVGVSRTVGALTEYEVYLYRAQMLIEQVELAEHHRWLTIDEMLTGETASGRRTGDPELFRLINAGLVGGFERVPVSLDVTDVRDFRAHVEGRPPPPLFIGHGHSPVWRELADHLRDQHGYRIVAFESARRSGRSITDILVDMTREASFAILVHTAEDEQADGRLRARQNVIHETGLFQGCLGLDRAIVVREHGCEDFSNLAGVQELHYRNEIREVFGDVLAALRHALL